MGTGYDHLPHGAPRVPRRDSFVLNLHQPVRTHFCPLCPLCRHLVASQSCRPLRSICTLIIPAEEGREGREVTSFRCPSYLWLMGAFGTAHRRTIIIQYCTPARTTCRVYAWSTARHHCVAIASRHDGHLRSALALLHLFGSECVIASSSAREPSAQRKYRWTSAIKSSRGG